MNPIIKRIVQNNVSKLSKDELSKYTSKYDTNPMYDSRNEKINQGKDYPTKKSHYVHRHYLIVNACVHFTSIKHREKVSYYHPWMKGYLEKVGKALWSQPPTFIIPPKKTEKEEGKRSKENDKEPEEDEHIKEEWTNLRLQEACRKAWHKSQVHGFCFFYPMMKQFFKGYSGPSWTVYSIDEMGQPSLYNQGHPVKWTINHTNKEKAYPKEISVSQGIFYDYKNTDDFTGEPFGIGIWDILIDWLWIQDAVNAFDQRMGNGFFTLVVPNNTDPTQIAKYESVIRNTRTEMGIVVTGSVEEPVQMNWVGMAGVQVDFIQHLEKLEDLIAFNMGFPKRWIMGDAEGARENGSNDALAINIQLKNLYTEWILFIKKLLQQYKLIAELNDIIIKAPFELQLSEQEQIELDAIKADTIAKKTWLSVDEQREEDGYEPSGEEGADKVMMDAPQEEGVDGESPGDKKEDQKKTPGSPKSATKTDTKSTIWELDVWVDKGHEKAFKNYMWRFDIKDLDMEVMTKREDDTRYSVSLRYFGKGSPWRSGRYWEIKNDWQTGKFDTKKDTLTSKLDAMMDILTQEDLISARKLAVMFNVAPGTICKMRYASDEIKKPKRKTDSITYKLDAISLGDDIYEIEDVPVILPQTKFYEHLGYEAIRPKEEIERIFNDPKYPKQFRIGATITDDHASRKPLEILNENTVGTVELKRIDEEGNIRGNIRYSLKDADRILGSDNYIRQRTLNNENINTSVALESRDKPTSNGKVIESDLDIRSFVFTEKNARNAKAGL